MNKIVRKIEFTGKNLNDVFKLPCVKAILKVEGQPMLILYPSKTYGHSFVNPGDTLLQYTDKMWDVEPEEKK